MNQYDSLGAALEAHGIGNTAGAALTTIPIWICHGLVYCTAKRHSVEVHELERLVWAYAERYSNRFGLYRGYQLVLWDRDGSATVLHLRKAFVDAALNHIREAAPWMPVGYSEAMKESWNADRIDFIASIDSYRTTGKRFEADWAGSEIALVRLEPDY